ncbi:serine acetyltransferase [Candidatus Ozemobacteraceae bacterium]|nr:serine acetyltransferase [Candidatus Ozemobacteraceae bacterium]
MNPMLKKLTEKVMAGLADGGDGVQHFDASPLPDKREMAQILEDALFLIFPGYYGDSRLSFESMELQVGFRVATLYEKLQTQVLRESQHSCRFAHRSCKHCQSYAALIARTFIEELPAIRSLLEDDVRAAYRNDPAASGFDEIIFSYPGLEAIAVYRIAHHLNDQGLILIPRIMTEWAHARTGIDIHPGAKIGRSFFIDHGTGVVIGQTTIIGERVTLYQGVTIGALNFPRDSQGNVIRNAKRHPTIEDDVVIYAGATILGGGTVIGRGSVIGGNVWLTESVPPETRVLMAKPQYRITSARQAPHEGIVVSPE